MWGMQGIVTSPAQATQGAHGSVTVMRCPVAITASFTFMRQLLLSHLFRGTFILANFVPRGTGGQNQLVLTFGFVNPSRNGPYTVAQVQKQILADCHWFGSVSNLIIARGKLLNGTPNPNNSNCEHQAALFGKKNQRSRSKTKSLAKPRCRGPCPSTSRACPLRYVRIKTFHKHLKGLLHNIRGFIIYGNEHVVERRAPSGSLQKIAF